MKGAPSYFRYGVAEAATRRVRGHEMNTGRPIRATYATPGCHFAIHMDEYITDEAQEELDLIFDKYSNPLEFERQLIKFLIREFPGCMALIPPRRRQQFMQGMYRAIEDGRTGLNWAVSHMLEDDEE